MQIRETWSITEERIKTFFLGQCDVKDLGNGCFAFGACMIRITALPLRQVGQLSFPQTRVEFSGPESDTDKIHQCFVLQFISAGG